MRTLITVGLLLITLPLYAADIEKASSPRLKFKSGAVCMCADGLTEKDIRASMMARKTANKNSSKKIIQQNATSQRSDEEDK